MSGAGKKTVVIIQARTGSERLPGKVLKQLPGGAVLEHTVNRARKIVGVDEVVVATTIKPSDDPIVELAGRIEAPVFRGDEDDVLSRYHGAMVEHSAETIIRITSDCPLLDPGVSAEVLSLYNDSHKSEAPADYCSNSHIIRTYPRGLDTEIFSARALDEAHREATAKPEREHVTMFIYNHPERYKLLSYTADADYSNHRWTLDTPDDFKLIDAVFHELWPKNRNFGWRDVLDFLDRRPEVYNYNSHIEQKKV